MAEGGGEMLDISCISWILVALISAIGAVNIKIISVKMMHSRKELAEKDRKVVFAREIVTKNPVFTREHC
jgi:hypothetical protein